SAGGPERTGRDSDSSRPARPRIPESPASCIGYRARVQPARAGADVETGCPSSGIAREPPGIWAHTADQGAARVRLPLQARSDPGGRLRELAASPAKGRASSRGAGNRATLSRPARGAARAVGPSL